MFTVPYRLIAGAFAVDKPRAWAPGEPFFTMGLNRNYDISPDGKFAAGMSDPGMMERNKPFTHVNFVVDFFDELRRKAPPAAK